MVQIKVKGLINGLHLYASFDHEEEFLEELKQRLSFFHVHGKVVEAFFHIPMLSTNGYHQLFQICKTYGMIIKGLEDTQARELKQMVGDVYNGQQLDLSTDTIWIGNIHKGSYMNVYGNLYVIGKVEGTIDAKYETCCIYASYIDASIRICDSKFHNVTSFASSKVYYEHRQVILKETKGVAIWEKSSQWYQEKVG